MQLSQVGNIAESYWKEIPNHFPHVFLANFVIMPDHMHGILILDKVEPPVESLPFTDSVNDIPVGHMSKNSPKAGSVSTIIRSYKSVVTKHARKINPHFGWQSKFYDHIIRDIRAFENI